MFSIPSFYELGTCSDSYDHMLQQILSSPIDSENPNNSPTSMAEAKAVAASNSHKEAERRRRKRINGHIATLKSILPSNIKTDKASLLGEAVRRVKELKKTTAALSASLNEPELENPNTTTLKALMFPNETDELKLSRCENSGLMKATLSCEDRPDIIMDMIQALKTAEAKVVRAEMSTVGGRTKSVLWVKMVGSESDVGLGTLRRALRMVMDKSTLLAGSGQGLPGNKRPRYYHL
ncbi:transcription factor bhlh30 [Phtheirospermum japonicum]|uniref:Transcription factor bhlh30 n=1 Tax=Phtheirospermum japonicum TaxID=374723 RepID=A0A830CSJ3_9LAMI|nr:transcription factor bhlh30 [Phtheirospermum japonicum]